jgi:hypothetical protein
MILDGIEMVDRWINTFMVQVDAAGAAQSLVERERTVTEVVHWEAPNTGEAAHRERVRYQQVGGGWGGLLDYVSTRWVD